MNISNLTTSGTSAATSRSSHESGIRATVAHRKPLVWLTIAAFALGQANCVRNGVLDSASTVLLHIAFGLLALSLAACAMGLRALGENVSMNPQEQQNAVLTKLLRIVPTLMRFSVLDPALLALWFFLLLAQVVDANVALDYLFARAGKAVWPALLLGLLVIVGMVWSLRSPRGWWLQLFAFVVSSGWLIWHNIPQVDVFVFQHDSCAALMRGQNPYAITFPNPYPDASPFLAKGLSVHGRLQFGYVYMPLTLLLTLPGFLLGDVRISHIAAIAVSALLLAGVRPRAEKALLGALFLWMPLVYGVVSLSWTDPFCVLTLCLVFFCARRCPLWLPVACGLFLASKQYALLALPLLWLLAPLTASSAGADDTSSTRLRGGNHWSLFWPFLVKTLAVTALVTLPLALWNFRAFYLSTMSLQFKQPFRVDSLSFLVLWSEQGWALWPWWLPFVLTLAALMWALRRAPRNEVGFLASVALLFLVFFAFNKQAFVNYYFFVMSALWCATMALFERSLHERNLPEGSRHNNRAQP